MHSRNKLLGLLLVTVGVIAVAELYQGSETKTSVSVWIPSQPTTGDPIAANYISNQMVFRSSLATLVSKHKVGNYEPMIAKSWTASNDHRIWTFRIRDDWKFSNGERILPEHIAKSWQRLIFIGRTKPIHPLLSNILGSKDVTAFETPPAGLRFTRDSLTIQLRESEPNLLDIISTGLFSVVHPSQYERSTGKWIESKRIVSSGPYEITSWDDTSLTLQLRNDNKSAAYHPSAIRNIRAFWAKEDVSSADLALWHSLKPYDPKTYDFHGGPLSGTIYVRCHSWKHVNSICANAKDLQKLRDAYYEVIQDEGLKISNSFFPGFEPSKHSKSADDQRRVPKRAGVSFRYLISRNQLNAYFSNFDSHIEQAAGRIGFMAIRREVPTKDILRESDPNLSKYEVDFTIRATELDFSAIDVELSTIFLDESGLRLPDRTGRLQSLVKNKVRDLQLYTDIISDEALIWPVAHFSQGVLARKSSFDFSQANMLLPPIEFQWIGWR